MSLPSTIAPATKATKTSMKTTVAPALKCSYRSKPCNSVRATKLNGDFHKLCEYHRRRANINQQRVHQRRKLREYGESTMQQPKHMVLFGDSLSPSSVSSSSWSLMDFATSDKLYNQNYDEDLLSDIELEFETEIGVEPSCKPCGDLPLPDLQLLELLLSDNACNLPAVATSQPECQVFEFLDLNLLEA